MVIENVSKNLIIKIFFIMPKPPPDPIFVIRNETSSPSCLKTVENNNQLLIERYFS